jgi:uncharacterized protein (DUF58 family)
LADAPDYRTVLDPAFVSKLSRLDLIARLVVEGFLTGLHKSPYHGFSVEFAEHRPYNNGDAVRFVDWKLYAKTDRYYIKQFEEETNLRSHLMLDQSASMGYRSAGPITKLRYASLLAASLAYLMHGQQDAVGLLVFDETIKRLLPARASRVHFRRILAELEAVTAGRATRIGPALHAMADRIGRRGLVMLFSDLMDRPDEVMQGLRHFRHQRHEVVVFHVLDPAEESFPFQGETEFEDLETGRRLSTHAWEIKQAYLERVQAWTTRYRRACGEIGVEYVPISTATPFDIALFRYLEKRGRLN